MQIGVKSLCAILTGRAATGEPEPQGRDAPETLTTLSIAARLHRTGKEIALIVDGGEGPAGADTSLARLVAKAHVLHRSLAGGMTINALARREGVGRTYLLRLLRLAYLAPDIVEAIVAGREPRALTVNRLMKQVQLPLGWAEQRRALGFG